MPNVEISENIKNARDRAYKLVKTNNGVMNKSTSVKEKMQSKELAVSELNKILLELFSMLRHSLPEFDDNDMTDFENLIEEIKGFIFEINGGKAISNEDNYLTESNSRMMELDQQTIEDSINKLKLIESNVADGIIKTPINLQISGRLRELADKIEVSLTMYKFKYIDSMSDDYYKRFCEKEKQLVLWVRKTCRDLENRR